MSFDPLRILVPEALAEPVQAALAVSTAAPFEVVVRRGEAPFDAAGFDAVLIEFPAAESDLPAHSAATATRVTPRSWSGHRNTQPSG